MSNVVPVDPSRGQPRPPRPAYLPQFPWKKAGIVGAVVVLSAAGYLINSWRKEHRLRASILRAHAIAVERYGPTYRPMSDAVVDMLREAAAVPYPGDFHDPAFRAGQLEKARGLYARVRLSALGDRPSLLRAARLRSRDAVPACLNLLPTPTADLIARGTVLESDFLRKVRRASDVLRLRVLDRILIDAVRRDLPRLSELRGTDYVLIVVDETGEPAGAPVRLYVWDLRQRRALLRVRTVPEGGVIAARIEGHGARPPSGPPSREVANTANDCALAQHAREASDGPPEAPGTR